MAIPENLVTPDDAPGGRSANTSVLLNVGTAVTVVGILGVLFAAYLLGYSNLQAGRDQRRLLAAYSASGELAAFRGHTPDDGAPVAVLSIPRLGLDELVVEGTSAVDLQSGPGLMPGSAVPGTRGIAVIAARHGTFGAPFADLSRMKPGDALTVTDYLGRFRYRVDSLARFTGGRGPTVEPTVAPLLDLVTSASSWPPSGLVVVRAGLVGQALPTAAASTASRTTSAVERGLGGDPGSLWQLGVWGGLLAVAIALTVAAYRRVRRPGLVYLLSTPVLLPLVLFSFENTARLLPATM